MCVIPSGVVCVTSAAEAYGCVLVSAEYSNVGMIHLAWLSVPSSVTAVQRVHCKDSWTAPTVFSTFLGRLPL